MLDLFPAAAGLAWPAVIALAWIAGELVRRWLPRISVYALVGFLCSPGMAGLLPPASADATGIMLANIAFGLILFEFGYRINIRWLRANPWLGATAALDSLLTFAVVYLLARWLGAPVLAALLLASLSMATSPASLMHVVNEERSSGQVTERALHLAAVSCLFALFAFKVVLGFWTFDSSGNLLQAVSNSAISLAVSAGLGAAFGTAVPPLLRRIRRLSSDGTVGFAIAVVLLVAITHALKLSPLVAGLTFGLVARHRRVTLDQTQRNFGVLGELLAVVLFAHVGATVEWSRVQAGLGLGLALVLARVAAKIAVASVLARAGGITVRKGVLTGVAMAPLSAFVVLLLENTRYLGVDLMDTLAPLAAATLLLGLAGPLATQLALRHADESAASPSSAHHPSRP
jgi:Kef-type K+ transport system membrane component KefB